jgi:retron-type reverse transcriptase
MVFFLKPGENENKLLEKVSNFLAERGMNVSEKKTKVTATIDGFDFLGWRFYVQSKNGKFRSVPSEDNFKAFREKVKVIVNNSNYGAQVKAEKRLANIALVRLSRLSVCEILPDEFGIIVEMSEQKK